MTFNLPGMSPNRQPTPNEISSATLHMDPLGMKLSNILGDCPVDPDLHIKEQDVLPRIVSVMAIDGWALAGTGYFAAVFVKDGLALKVGLKARDTGSMYAAWCRANAGQPGVPEVFSVTKFYRCWLLLTKRYEVVDKAWLDERSEAFLPDMAIEYSALRWAINAGHTSQSVRFDTVKTAVSIHQFFKGVVDFDLHKANIMLDDKGNLVITDPISYGACSGAGYYHTESDETTYETA